MEKEIPTPKPESPELDSSKSPSENAGSTLTTLSGQMYASAPFSDARFGVACSDRKYFIPDHIRDQYK